jgi:hypothetical protein
VWKPDGKRPLGRVKVDGGTILKWILKKWDGNVYWIDLAQNRDSLQTLVSAVTNLQFP